MVELDDVVTAVLNGIGARRPLSALGLAHACGLRLVLQEGRADGLVGTEVRYDRRFRGAWRQAFVARCVAQWALRWCGVPESREAIDYVARAFTHAHAQRMTA